jgi:hypothetical protein
MLKAVWAEPVDAASSTQFWASSSRWIPRKSISDATSGHGAYGLGPRQDSGTRGILAGYGRVRILVRVCRVSGGVYLERKVERSHCFKFVPTGNEIDSIS